MNTAIAAPVPYRVVYSERVRQRLLSLAAVALPAAVFLWTAAAPAFGRLIENWPYDRLFKEADLVIIARAESTMETKDRLEQKQWKGALVGQETAFTVQTTLKGKHHDKGKLRVLHFRLADNLLVMNGPLLVAFRNQPLALKGTVNGTAFKAALGRPEYMLFLRRRPDGRYEPVSGQIDPALSVRELHEPDGFLSQLGRK